MHSCLQYPIFMLLLLTIWLNLPFPCQILWGAGLIATLEILFQFPNGNWLNFFQFEELWKSCESIFKLKILTTHENAYPPALSLFFFCPLPHMTLKGLTSRCLNPWLHFNLRASLVIESISWLWMENKIFLVPATVLCFWFSVRIMLITHWCLGCESRTVPCLILCPQAHAQEAVCEGTQPGQLT